MAKTQAVTILFCDLVASTERRARLGDDAFDDFNRQLFVVLRHAIDARGGREVSNAGDGMMVVFPDSVADAVACASEMHAGAAELDTDDPPQLRIGISCGEVAQDGDNYSGMPIVEAARLEAAAAPGQTLANAVVRALVGTRRALRFRDVGTLALKGIPEPLPAVEVVTDDVATMPAPSPVAPKSNNTKRRALFGVAGIAVLVAVALLAVTLRGTSHHASSTEVSHLTAAYPVSYQPKACPPDLGTRIQGVTCATLTVPEDRSKPHGRVVKLDVYRAPARGRATSDPVLDFGADDLASSPARDHSDEILLAQRGWGEDGVPSSDPVLRCAEYTQIAGDALVKPSGDATETGRAQDAFRTCYARLTREGVDLNQYNYLTDGDDMVDLIRALHLEHVNLVSGYVATLSALEVTRALPAVVRSLTLQDPVPGNRSQYTDPTRYLSDAFKSYVALCHADKSCNTSFPNLAEDLKRDYDNYRLHPVVASGDDGQGHKHDVLIDGPRVAQAIWAGLFDNNDFSLLAAGIAAPDRTQALNDLTAGRIMFYNAANVDDSFAWGAQLSDVCSYDLYTIDRGHTLSSSTIPELSGVDGDFLTKACSVWPVRKLPDVAFDDPHTNAPTFAVSGNLSPGTDQAWPDEFQRSLPNAVVAIFPTLNGRVLGANDPKCLADLRRRFLENPTATLDVGACVNQSPPIHFAASAGG